MSKGLNLTNKMGCICVHWDSFEFVGLVEVRTFIILGAHVCHFPGSGSGQGGP